MTNKEKFKEVFGLEIDDTSDCGFFDCTDGECKDCLVKDTKDWWNAEYKESTEKKITEEDILELKHRYGDEVEFVVRDMISGEGKRWE